MRTMVTFCDICGQMVPMGEPVPMTIVTRTSTKEKNTEVLKTKKADICPGCAAVLSTAMSEIRRERD